MENQVTLTWDAPASDAASVTGYEILRRRPNEGEAALTTLVADTGNAETGYTDDTANEPGVRTYRVRALRDGEQSRVSNYARIDLPDEPTPTPEALAPSGLTAEAAKDGGVALSWTAPAEDAGSVTGYEVLRARGNAELTTLAADTGSTDTAYADETAIEAGETYAYQVKALRGEEKSQVSNRASITLPDEESARGAGDATGVPTISGTPAVGELLTAGTSNIGDPDGVANADFEYQWIAFDGTTDSDISGATRGDLPAAAGPPGPDHQGPGQLRRRQRQRRVPDQRADGGGDGLHLRTGHLGGHPHRRGRNPRRRDILRLFDCREGKP